MIHAMAFIVFCIIRNPAWIGRPAMLQYLGTLFNRHVLERGHQDGHKAAQHAIDTRRGYRARQAVNGRTDAISARIPRAGKTSRISGTVGGF